MSESELREFLFDSDVALALMCGLSYEEAIEEAKQIRREEREWQRLTSRAVDEGDSAPLQAESTTEHLPIEEADTMPALHN